MSICEATTLDRISLPSATTAAAVSSHDDSIPRMRLVISSLDPASEAILARPARPFRAGAPPRSPHFSRIFGVSSRLTCGPYPRSQRHDYEKAGIRRRLSGCFLSDAALRYL